uniref:Uncharacterized protein n=2 Tax=unclassified Rosemountvirus TaxID=2738372 RepID=A0AAU8GGZ3_9CAUD
MTNKVVVQKVVGEISIRCEASSDRRDVSMQDLLNIANMGAGNEDTVTGREGVNLTVTMSGPDAPAAPLFTPVEEPRPRGISYGQITKAEEVRKQEEAERRHIEVREDRVSLFRANVRRSVMGYEMTAEGFSKALEAAICNAANHFRSLLDEMNRNMAKLNAEKANLHKQVNDAVSAMQKQAEDFNKQADQHAQTVDKIVSTRREVEKELEQANRTIKRMKDYAVRLNSVC